MALPIRAGAEKPVPNLFWAVVCAAELFPVKTGSKGKL
jgi:hypothetical protein